MNFLARPDALDEHGQPAAIAHEVQPFAPGDEQSSLALQQVLGRHFVGKNRLDLVFLPATLALDQAVVSDKAIG